MLTKSLHTVTAATNVARHMLSTARAGFYSHGAGAEYLAADALSVLGYTVAGNADSVELAAAVDDTVARIVKACDKLLSERTPSAAARRAEYEGNPLSQVR